MREKLLFTLVICFLFTSLGVAQNWNVGQPVSMLLSDLQLSGGNCYPTNDDLIYFPNSQVDGVEHVFVVNAASPQGTVSILPSPGVVAAGDTIVINAPFQQHQVFFSNGTGSLSLSVFAVGMPTLPGQPHPCNYSPLWMSNLLLCNEGLNNNIPTNCTTQSATGIPVEGTSSFQISWPNVANGNRISMVDGDRSGSFAIMDMHGRIIAASQQLDALRSGIDLSGQVNGAYLLRIVANGRRTFSERFVIVH